MPVRISRRTAQMASRPMCPVWPEGMCTCQSRRPASGTSFDADRPGLGSQKAVTAGALTGLPVKDRCAALTLVARAPTLRPAFSTTRVDKAWESLFDIPRGIGSLRMVEIWITHVDHDKNSNGAIGPIRQVCASYKNQNNELVGKRSYTRLEILSMLRAFTDPTMQNGRPYAVRVNAIFTAIADNGGLKIGDEVEETKDGQFITTRGNTTTRDNLGNLPPCDC